MLLGLGVGFGFLFLRENLLSSNQVGLWNSINNILFQDISVEAGSQAIGLFYIVGKLFVNSLQLIIVPMVFTSILLAMCKISDTKKLGRISYKTIGLFFLTSSIALVFAGIVGYVVYNAGLFNVSIEGINAATGKVGTNPLNIFVNIIPGNILSVFTSNGAVLSIVFLAVVIGYIINVRNKESYIRNLSEEIHEIITIFLSFVVNKFGPIAIFCLLTRTFAIYGIEHLKPALTYVVTTVVLLLVYLFVGYALFIFGIGKLNPFHFIRKIAKVAVFGFSTSSSAATLPLNTQTNIEELGVSEEITSFVLPLGMTINMDGTAIMQVIAAIFIAASGGFELTIVNIFVIGILALIASIGTPAAPGAGAVILFTVLSGMGYTTDACLLAYSLILAINRPIEMLVTSLNVVGDSAAAVCVAKSEQMLDIDKYNN